MTVFVPEQKKMGIEFSYNNKERIRLEEKKLTPELIGHIKYLEAHQDKLKDTDKEMWELLNSQEM